MSKEKELIQESKYVKNVIEQTKSLLINLFVNARELERDRADIDEKVYNYSKNEYDTLINETLERLEKKKKIYSSLTDSLTELKIYTF